MLLEELEVPFVLLYLAFHVILAGSEIQILTGLIANLEVVPINLFKSQIASHNLDMIFLFRI